MAPFSTGLSLTYRLALSVINVINASLPPIPVYKSRTVLLVLLL